jgi:integrase
MMCGSAGSRWCGSGGRCGRSSCLRARGNHDWVRLVWRDWLTCRVDGWAAATGADIEHLGIERGHRTLTITRKGGKVVTIPLAPRTARAIDLATGERCDGPVFLTGGGRRLDRHGGGRIVRKIARRAGITSPSDRTRSGTHSSPPPK